MLLRLPGRNVLVGPERPSALGARLGRHEADWTALNIAVRQTPEGGPGIVMAGVAYERRHRGRRLSSPPSSSPPLLTSQAAGLLARLRAPPEGLAAPLRRPTCGRRGLEPETEAPAAPVPTAVNGHAAKQPVG